MTASSLIKTIEWQSSFFSKVFAYDPSPKSEIKSETEAINAFYAVPVNYDYETNSHIEISIPGEIFCAEQIRGFDSIPKEMRIVYQRIRMRAILDVGNEIIKKSILRVNGKDRSVLFGIWNIVTIGDFQFRCDCHVSFDCVMIK